MLVVVPAFLRLGMSIGFDIMEFGCEAAARATLGSCSDTRLVSPEAFVECSHVTYHVNLSHYKILLLTQVHYHCDKAVCSVLDELKVRYKIYV